MKQSLILFCLLTFFYIEKANAQDNKALTNLLLQKKLITQKEADSLEKISIEVPIATAESKEFAIGLEFRPRTEFRNGYRQLRTEDTKAAFFTSQRSRLNVDFKQNQFQFHTSIQDTRIWGQYGQISTSGSLNVYEAYVETGILKNFSAKIGRQKIELDNGRIFASANWSQAARAHDGLNLIYHNSKIHSEFFTAFNQTSEPIFDTDFSPTTFSNYKLLNVHYLKTKLNNNFSFTTINAADSYQSKTNKNTLYSRGTSGGRIDFEKGNLALTLSGYYQFGQLQSGSRISAFYFQPEILLKTNKLISRLGAEIMSGDNADKPNAISKSFVPLYGVAWKFMGNMDYFTNFPNDVKNGGLINPYLLLNYKWNKKLSLQSDFHLFYLANKVKNEVNQNINSYLGFENDLSLHYKCNSFALIDFGFSYMAAQKSMETLKGGTSSLTPIWSYLMITFKPELFRFKK